MTRLAGLGVLMVLTGTGCAGRVTFSQSLRSAHDLDDPGSRGSQLHDLQYFVSKRMLLRRRAQTRDGNVKRGRLVVRQGRLVEEVVVRRNTPGVVVDSGDGWIAVSFAKGTSFVFDHVQDPVKGELGVYRLRQDTRDGHNVVDFGGGEYRTVGASRWATLQVRSKVRERRTWRRNVLKGRRLK